MRHSFYGDLQGSFEGRGWDFFKRGWWLWLLAPIAIYMTPLAPFIYGAFKAIEWKWWVEGLRFGDVSFRSTLRSDALIGRYNSDLANGLGNLASRTLTMIHQYRGGVIPKRSEWFGGMDTLAARIIPSYRYFPRMVLSLSGEKTKRPVHRIGRFGRCTLTAGRDSGDPQRARPNGSGRCSSPAKP